MNCRWVSVRFDVKTYNLNPSVAYRVSNTVSLGFGLNWQRMMAQYLRLVAVNTPTNASSPLKLTMDGNAWGWNVGALFTVSPTGRVPRRMRHSPAGRTQA